MSESRYPAGYIPLTMHELGGCAAMNIGLPRDDSFDDDGFDSDQGGRRGDRGKFRLNERGRGHGRRDSRPSSRRRDGRGQQSNGGGQRGGRGFMPRGRNGANERFAE